MLAGIIARWAETQPDKTALDYNARIWSYCEFAERIAVARGHFHRMGLAGDGVVALAMNNIRDFWVASPALRSLGLTTIALQTADALTSLHLPALRCVVTSARESWPGLEAACAARRTSLFALDRFEGAPFGLDVAPARSGGHILQTSGTTGQIKLILFDPSFELDYIEHRRVAGLLDANTVFNVFDFAVWTGVGYKSPFSAWSVGGSVVVNQGQHPSVALTRPGVNYSAVVPSLLRIILSAPDDAFPRNEHMLLKVTGGTITQGEINAAKARISPRLYNALGATESNSIAFTPLDSPDDHRWHAASPGTVIEIVDDADRPVPRGEMGRLRVLANHAPDHYLDDPATTRLFFRDGFFYPGDLAVMRSDGRFALMGRITDVINMGGHKISPEPIEDGLRDALAVTGLCLVSMQNSAGEETMHVVIEAAAPFDVERLADALRPAFEGYPGVQIAGVSVHYTPALPRNEMGKVLRREVAEKLARSQNAGT